jgi:hypothetical protein
VASRRAVAATLVSVIVFTSLLFANAALYSAGGTYLSSAVLSAAQQREVEYASLLTGVSSYSSLAAAQSYLQSHPLDCSSPEASYTSSMAGSGTVAGTNQGIEYSVRSSWSYAAVPAGSTLGAGAEGASMVGPFSGGSAGALNLVVDTSINESELGGFPTYQEDASALVHLPVPLEDAVALCTSSLSALGRSLSSLASCNSTGVNHAIDLLRSENPGLGAAAVGASAEREATLGQGRCLVQYWVSVSEDGVEGVAGTFDWSLFGSGSLST